MFQKKAYVCRESEPQGLANFNQLFSIMINNKDYKIQILKENFKNDESGITMKEYVEHCANSDPNFFRWLFDKEFDNDFSSSLNEEERESYSSFINEL